MHGLKVLLMHRLLPNVTRNFAQNTRTSFHFSGGSGNETRSRSGIGRYQIFMGHGFTSKGQDLGSMFNAAVCKIQASKRYIGSLPLVLKDERSSFSQGERFAVQLPLDHALTFLK